MAVRSCCACTHPRVVYLREAEILPELDAWLGKSLDLAHLPETLDALAASQNDEEPHEAAALRDEIAQCDRRLAQYRAALDSGEDPAVVGQWITETHYQRVVSEGDRPRIPTLLYEL